MINVVGASRWYGQVIGVNDVTCEIGPGVTALLGQNGAGKSTLMRLMTGQMRPTTGSVRVFGQDPFANPAVFRRLGFCPDTDACPPYLSGREFVYRAARLSGYSHSESISKSEQALQTVGMENRAHQRSQAYSKGMRQRINLAQAIVHDPDVLLLDEPLNGLDPVGRRQFMDVLAKLSEQGKSIVVSSHVLFEVEQMTRSLLLLHHGRLLATGELADIRSLIDKHPHRIQISTSNPRQLAAHVVCLPYVVSVEVGQTVEVQTREPNRFYDELPRLVLEEGLDVTGVVSPDANMEAVFSYLVAE